MSIQIDLPAEWETRLRDEAASQGQDPAEYAADLLKRLFVLQELEALKNRKPPQSLDELKPRVPTPPGRSWIESIAGQWPGDESDEEIERILEEMS
jgi:hypothetical protein